MKKIFMLSLVLLALFCLQDLKAQKKYNVIRGERPPIDIQNLPDDAYEKGVLKIKLVESLTDHLDNQPVYVNESGRVIFNIASIDELNAQYEPTRFDKLFGQENPSFKYYERHRAWGFHLWYTLYFDESANIKEMIKAYAQLAEVSVAEPQYKTQLHNFVPVEYSNLMGEEDDKKIKFNREGTPPNGNQGTSPTDWTPNDPSYGLQWHYHNTGQYSGTVDADIDLPEAWNIETGYSNVIVSIHDQGVQYNHPDLNGNMWVNSGEIAGNGIDDDGNGYIDDIYGFDFYNNNGTIEAGYHGTHVGGTVAAESNNSSGVAGIAGGTGSNDGVRLMTCMVYHASGGSGVGHHLAPVYAADNGACIEQNSWGYTSAGYYDQAVLDAIDYFNLNGGGSALSGGLTIYSAGNTGTEGNYYPGCYSGVIGVAATNNQDIKSYYSTYGTWVDIAAPGGETHIIDERGVYSTFTTNTYDYLQGTSMACPHVSGTAALIVSLAYNQLTSAEARTILLSTTDGIDVLNPTYAGKLGSGRLNAYQALLETQTYLGTPGVWAGTVSTDWFNGANWDDGNVPTSTTPVSIPAGTPYSPVIGSGTAYCSSLFMYSGTSLTQENNSYFYCYGTFDAGFGTFTMNGSASYLYFAGNGNNVWWDDYQDDTYTNVRVNKSISTASMNMQNNMTCSGTFEIREGIFSMNNGTTLTVTNTGLYAFEVEGGGTLLLDYSTKTIDVTGSVHFMDGSQATLSDGTIRCGANFNNDANTSYNITFTGGTLIMDGASTQYINDLDGGVLDLYNLTIEKSGGTCYIQSGNLDIYGSLVINGGALSCNNGPSPTITNNINIAGNWTNNVGAGGFEESSGRVIFNGGNYHQYCSTETFNILEVNKPLGGAFRVNTGTVVCAAYDWTAGAVDVNTGTFTANDLLDGMVKGAFYVNPDGTINLINSGTGTYVDLQGELYNWGGTINITGSISWWPYTGDAHVEMTGGVIDLTNCGLYLSTNNNLTTAISGGTIKMNGGFTGNRSDFTPTAGTIECYGTNDVNILQTNGCTVYNFVIDKSAGDSGSSNSQFIGSGGGRIDPTINFNSDANTASLASNFVVNGMLNVNSGSLRINGFQLDVSQDINIAGNLIMDNPADVINGGNQIVWNSGATEQVSAGTINLDYRMLFQDGSNVQIGPGNTLNLIGTVTTAIRNFSSVAEIGNLNIAMPPSSGTCYISYTTTYPVVVAGDLNVYANNYFHIQEYDVFVNGNMNIASGATVELGSILGPGYLDVDGTLTNNGTLLVDYDETAKKSGIGSEDESLGQSSMATASAASYKDDPDWFAGEVYIHGHFTQSATGTTSILGGGTFICDEPTTSLVSVVGNFNLDDGLFEISNNHLSLNAVCNISGGTIRSGGTFWASIDGNFQPTAGVVELIGNGGTGQYIQVHANNYFHDLTINRTNTIMIYTGYNLNVRNDFTIISGGLNTNTRDMYVGGDWDNQAGLDAFIESTGKVVFNGPGPEMQFINSDEYFNIIENNTSQAIRVNSALDVVECNSYSWISGSVSVSLGTFIAYDLAQSGLYGNWYALTGSEIYLNQMPGQYVDLYCSEIIIYGGGLMKVTGGDDESYWCSNAPLNLDINTGGILDFDGYGITIWNNFPLTHDLVDGNIKTSGWLTCYRPDFNPAGTVEFYGGADSRIDIDPGSTLNNLLINKSGGDKSTYSWKDRDGATGEGTKSNTAYLMNNDLEITGNLTIDAGTLDISGYTMSCNGDANVNNTGILYVGDNAVFAMGNLSGLHVNNGGWLLAVATAGNNALMTHITGYYDLWIENGGYVSAENTTFEHMTTSGVYLRPGSVVNAVYSFNNCTFQNGSPGGNLMSIYSDQTFNVNDAVFPTNTWGGAYNVFKNVMTGNVYFNDATGDFAGSDYEFDPYNKVFWGDEILRLDLTVYLEGPYQAGGVMSTNLNTNGYLPLSHPYAPTMPYYDMTDPGDIPWYYTGTGTVSSIPPNVVDWVIVELRDATTPANATSATTIGTKAAFLMNDGSIVDLDGFSTLNFDVIFTNNLYAVVFHRNHLGVMSSTGLTQTGGIYTYDFSTGASQAYGGSNGHKEIEPGIWGMVAADGNGNGLIQNTDETAVWKVDLGNSGYMGGDFEMTGLTQNTDETNFWKPNLGGGGQVPAKAGTGYVSQVPK